MEFGRSGARSAWHPIPDVLLGEDRACLSLPCSIAMKVLHTFGNWTCLCKLLCPCPELAIDIFVDGQRLSRLHQRYTMMVPQVFDGWLCLCKLLCPCPGLAIGIFVGWQRLSRLLQHCAMMVLQVFGSWPCLWKLCCQCLELAFHMLGAEPWLRRRFSTCLCRFFKCLEANALGLLPLPGLWDRISGLRQVAWVGPASSADPSHCRCQFREAPGSRRLVFFTQATREVCAASLFSVFLVHAPTLFCFNQVGI